MIPREDGDGSDSDLEHSSEENFDELMLDRPQRKRELFGPSFDDIQADVRPGGGKRGRKRGGGQARSKLPPNLASMMGAANMHYISKEFDKAVSLLMEVVRQAPRVPDPFHTLGLIHEEIDKRREATEFYLIAAHLSPKDPGLWKRLAHMYRQQDNIPHAIYCFSKAIRLDATDLDSIWDRSMLQAQIGKRKKAIEGLQTILQVRPTDRQVIEELARMHVAQDDLQAAIGVIWGALVVTMGDTPDLHLINALTELYVQMGEYDKAIDLINSTRRHLAAEVSVPLELTAQHGLCLAYLGRLSEAEPYLNQLLDADVGEYSDLFFRVAEAFMAVGEIERALSVFQQLTVTPEFNKPAIWLRHAQCSQMLGMTAQAVESCRNVPCNIEATIMLAELFGEQGLHQNALVVLDKYLEASHKEHEESSVSTSQQANEIRILVQKGLIYYELEDFSDFLSVCLPLVVEAVKPDPEHHRDRSRRRKKSRRTKESKAQERKEHDESLFLTPGRRRRRQAEISDDEYIMDDLSDDLSHSHVPTNGGLSSQPQKNLFAVTPTPPPPLVQLPECAISLAAAAAAGGSTNTAAEMDVEESLQAGRSQEGTIVADKRILAKDKLGESRLSGEEHIQVAGVEEEEIDSEMGEKVGERATLLSLLGEDGFFEVVMKVVKALSLLKRFDEALEVCTNTLSRFRFLKRDKKVQLRFLAVGIAYNLQDYATAFERIRWICVNRPYSTAIYNLYSKIVAKAGLNLSDLNSKFLVRLLVKHPTSMPLMILVGHHCFMSGCYGLAIAEYLRAYRNCPDDPMLNLCIGLSYLHQVMNRRQADRHSNVLKAFSFLYKYHRLQKQNAEATYNIGRAHHHLGINHLAVHFYNKVLSSGTDEDLRMQAAFNLSQIYLRSGNLSLARSLIQCNIVF